MPARTFTISGEQLAAGDINKAVLQFLTDVWVNNRVKTGIVASSGSQGVVNVSTTAVQVLAANTSRLGGHVVNNSSTTT